jgi:hypothetical protein
MVFSARERKHFVGRHQIMIMNPKLRRTVKVAFSSMEREVCTPHMVTVAFLEITGCTSVHLSIRKQLVWIQILNIQADNNYCRSLSDYHHCSPKIRRIFIFDFFTKISHCKTSVIRSIQCAIVRKIE